MGCDILFSTFSDHGRAGLVFGLFVPSLLIREVPLELDHASPLLLEFTATVLLLIKPPFLLGMCERLGEYLIRTGTRIVLAAALVGVGS